MAERKSRRALRPLVAATAALAMAGCSATHVGDDWQCPLAQGKVCASVAAADPAVPETGVPGMRGSKPLVQESRGGTGAADGPDCEAGCDPFAWLGALFAGIADAGSPEPGADASPRNGDVATARADTPAAAAGHSAPVTSGTDSAAITSAEPENASPPAGPDPAFDGAFRTGEVVARIWIAPFVDAGGIYREGSWVRAVIAPAQWRMP